MRIKLLNVFTFLTMFLFAGCGGLDNLFGTSDPCPDLRVAYYANIETFVVEQTKQAAAEAAADLAGIDSFFTIDEAVCDNYAASAQALKDEGCKACEGEGVPDTITSCDESSIDQETIDTIPSFCQ